MRESINHYKEREKKYQKYGHCVNDVREPTYGLLVSHSHCIICHFRNQETYKIKSK